MRSRSTDVENALDTLAIHFRNLDERLSRLEDSPDKSVQESGDVEIEELSRTFPTDSTNKKVNWIEVERHLNDAIESNNVHTKHASLLLLADTLNLRKGEDGWQL